MNRWDLSSLSEVNSKLGEIRTHFEGLGHFRWKTSTDLRKQRGKTPEQPIHLTPLLFITAVLPKVTKTQFWGETVAGWIVTWFTPVGSPSWQTTTLETGPFVLRHLPIWTAQIRRYVVSQSEIVDVGIKLLEFYQLSWRERFSISSSSGQFLGNWSRKSALSSTE